MLPLARWLATAALAAALGAGALFPSPAHASDDLIRVIVDVADIVYRSGHPYYRHGNYGYNDRLIAERDYRGRPLDVHLVIVRSAESNASAHDEPWRRLARGAELHVLPGDHVTLVTEAGGERFAAVIRGVIDRATARGGAS